MRSLGCVLLSAALYALAFPPVDWAPLAWIALVPLLRALSSAGPIRGAALGLAWGLAVTAGLGWPLPGMVEEFFGASPVLGWAALAAVGLVSTGLPFAAFGAWIAWLGRGAGPLAVACAWGAVDLVRGLVVGVPWGALAYSQHDASHVVQLADVAGPYGIGMLVAAANAALAGLAAAPRRQAWSAAAVAASVAAVVVYGGVRLRTPFASGEPVAVALVQPGGGAVDAATWLRLTEEAAAGAPRLVLWSENAVDVALEEAPATRALVSDAAPGADVLLGGPSYVWGRDGIRQHNSVFLVRDGAVAGRYDKRLLVPFAERAPRWAADDAGYAPGGRARTLRTVAGRVGAFVCGEAMYPELVRRVAATGVEVLANLSNDAWFRHPAAAEHHLRIAALRAVENRRWLLRTAKTGVSALVDPHGRVVARQAFGATGVVAASVARSRATTPYQRHGDGPIALVVGIGLVSTCAASRRRRATAKGVDRCVS